MMGLIGYESSTSFLTNNGTTHYGDSGGGVVLRRRDSANGTEKAGTDGGGVLMSDVLYGVISELIYPHYSLDESIKEELRMAGLAVPIPYILGGWQNYFLVLGIPKLLIASSTDLCLYLHLCGSGTSRGVSMMNKLRLASVYLPRGSVASLPAIKPFLPPVFVGAHLSKERNSMPQALEMIAAQGPTEGAPPTPLCIAIAVSRMHAITTRLCVTNRLHRFSRSRLCLLVLGNVTYKPICLYR